MGQKSVTLDSDVMKREVNECFVIAAYFLGLSGQLSKTPVFFFLAVDVGKKLCVCASACGCAHCDCGARGQHWISQRGHTHL